MNANGPRARWEALLDWRGIVAALVLVALGWLAGDWSMSHADLRMREELLRRVTQVAGMIDPESARALTFSAADKGTPAFEEIRGQMAASTQTFRQRSIYSMAIRNGGIVFGPESLDEDDLMASAPGEAYERPSSGDWEALRSGTPFVAGPVADEYGTFVTAVAPVHDPNDGEVLMAVGMDIPADEWEKQIVSARMPPLIGALLMALVLLGGIVAIRRRKGAPGTRGMGFGQFESALVAALGLFVTGGLFWQAERLNREHLAERFRLESGELAGLLRTEICRALVSVDSIRRFVECSDRVDADEFLAFVQPMLRGGGYRAFLWAPRVPASGRMEFGTAVRREGKAGFDISERDRQGRKVPLGNRDVYYPVQHVEPRAANAAAIGLDIGSDAGRRAVLEKARDTGRPVAVAVADFGLPAEGGDAGAAVLLITPVYDRRLPGGTVEQRRAGLAGFVAGSLDIGDRVKRMLRGTASQGIAHRVIDVSSAGIGRVMFDDRAGEQGPRARDARFHSTLDFPFADRIFRIESAPKPRFFAVPAHATQLWIILPLGVILALLSAGYMHRVVVSRSRAELEKLEMERRLLHAQKLESIGVLAGGIAHDFNNLLMAIQGNLDMAKVDLRPGSFAREGIDEAMRAVKRATELTRQLLAYAGKGQVRIEPVNLGEQVAENVRMLRAAIPRTVALDLHIDESVPPVLADPSQIQQVVMNLITNAAEAVGDRPGTVSIATGVSDCDAACLGRSCIEAKPKPGRFVRLTVTDTGCGMDRETLRQMFDPFFTTKLRGRGLGMSAVLGIVQAHQGAILIQSDVGRGTSVDVLLPAAGASVISGDGAGPPPAAAGAPVAAARSGAILVVDDEEAVRNLCGRMVERCGFRAIKAAGGREAVDALRAHKDAIACVILDMVMPDMDGIATFEALRRIRADVRVIRCSGCSEEETARHFEGMALTSFLQKPFHFATLKAELERMAAAAPHEVKG